MIRATSIPKRDDLALGPVGLACSDETRSGLLLDLQARNFRAPSDWLEGDSARKQVSMTTTSGTAVGKPELAGNSRKGRPLRGLMLAAACGLIALGCEIPMIQTGQFPRPMLFDDTLKWTRQGSAHFNTLHDFAVAREASYNGIGTLEGLYTLVPENEDALLMLNRGWVGLAFAFIDDDREEAIEKKDDTLAEYHTQRGRAACNRARFFGERLASQRADGFEAAQRNTYTLKAWLNKNYDDAEHAQELLWLGLSIVGQVTFNRDSPEAVSNLWIGVDILQHVLTLDETVENGLAHTALGSYHARTAMSELDESKAHFDRATQIHGGKMLTTRVSMAQTYYCMKRDKNAYMSTLKSVMEAKDPFPEQRLTNTMAKRKARRYLTNQIFQEECGFDL